jgi:hypothetical protein
MAAIVSPLLVPVFSSMAVAMIVSLSLGLFPVVDAMAAVSSVVPAYLSSLNPLVAVVVTPGVHLTGTALMVFATAVGLSNNGRRRNQGDQQCDRK